MAKTVWEDDAEKSWPQYEGELDAALANLRESDRRAVMLRFYEHKSFDEIAHILGTAEEAAKVDEYQKKLSELERKRDRARQMARELPGGIDSKELDGIVVDNLDAELLGQWTLSNYSTNFVDKNYLHDGNVRADKGKRGYRSITSVCETTNLSTKRVQ